MFARNQYARQKRLNRKSGYGYNIAANQQTQLNFKFTHEIYASQIIPSDSFLYI
jgi:hypothetical protein